MLRSLGLVAVLGFASNATFAKPPMVPSQAKELTPMERDHYVPDQTEGKPEFVPTLPPTRKTEESALLGLMRFDYDMIPRLTLPLGLAQRPGWVTR